MTRVRSRWILTFALIILTAACVKQFTGLPLPKLDNPPADAVGDANSPLLAGFAKEAVTPDHSVMMGGFGILRFSQGAHDDLFVRTVVLKQGSVKLALVEVDVVGLQRGDILEIKKGIAGFKENEVIIASTHTHSGPDTLGLWGLPPLFSGKSKAYMRRIGQAVADTIDQASAGAVEVSVAVNTRQLTPGIMANLNEGEPLDEAMGVVVFRDCSGKVVGTLLNVNGHPEAMWGDNKILSSDYAGRLCVLAEEQWGGGAVFFSADLGAMMSPARPAPGEPHDWARLERISQAIFQDVKLAVEDAQPETNPQLLHKQALIMIPVVNKNFIMLFRAGILNRRMYGDNQVISEVNLVEIGSAQFVTFPGEVYPKMGLTIRAKQKPHSFQIGLADDELGYIIYPRDFGTEMYEYESSMSTGPETSTIVQQALFDLMGVQ